MIIIKPLLHSWWKTDDASDDDGMVSSFSQEYNYEDGGCNNCAHKLFNINVASKTQNDLCHDDEENTANQFNWDSVLLLTF